MQLMVQPHTSVVSRRRAEGELDKRFWRANEAHERLSRKFFTQLLHGRTVCKWTSTRSFGTDEVSRQLGDVTCPAQGHRQVEFIA